jgi:putative nucleotidyltransferase with HDIG domain
VSQSQGERERTHADAIEKVWAAFLPELELISDAEIAASVVSIWAEVWSESGWAALEDAPKNPYTVNARHSTVTHTRSVTRQALAIAAIIEEHHGLTCDRDIILASCLLHDVSKLLEFEPAREAAGQNSRFGDLIQHGVYGMHKAFEHRLPVEVAHIIGSHTTQSRLPPKTLEAIIVHYADFVDTDALVWEAGGKLLLNASR